VLRTLYEGGLGSKKNLVKAFSCYQKAAKQGFAPAQYELGRYYEYGIGMEKNLAEALKFYKLSANQGYPEAQLVLKEFLVKHPEIKDDSQIIENQTCTIS
jgi:TPR repeat protein